MKRVIAAVLAFVVTLSLAGCSMSQTTETTSDISNPPQEHHDSPAPTVNNKVLPDDPHANSTPVNYMDEIKAEIHDELFREETPETLDIVNRIFKHLEVETITSKVDGDEAQVLLNITTINAGKAWVIGLEKYAILCAENLFSNTYTDDATLYSCYLEEFEKSVRKAEYIETSVTIVMDYENHRWVWDIDDNVVNAITGQLLAAIEGDLNSSNIVIVTPEVDTEIVPPVETDIETIQSEQNNTSPIIITGYDITTGYNDQKCLVVKYKWTNTTEQTVANWSEISIKAYQNGVQLDTNFAKYESSYKELDDNRDREIRPGVTLEMVRFFTLKDLNSYNGIEIEFSNYWENIIYAKDITAF